MECEVKWALESITMNKANGGDEIPVELFQILKDDAVKVLGSIKDRNGLDLTEAEDIKKRCKNTWKNCTKRIFVTWTITVV